MSLKRQLLEKLSEDEFLSGEAFAKTQNVSRAAIWKAIKALREEGYRIEAIPKKGYRLRKQEDHLEVKTILKHYHGQAKLTIELHETITSTNDRAKALAEAGATEWTVILSEMQSLGRGRLGKNFYSPKGSGIYLSVILRPKLAIEKATLLTLLGATVVCEVIEETLALKSQIKWVNDVFIADKKVSGILTEGSLSLESQILDYLVLGIGVNITLDQKSLPDSLKPIVGSLFENQMPPDDFRNYFIGILLTKLSQYYLDFERGEFIKRYRERLMVLDKWVDLHQGKTVETVKVLALDDKGALIVKTKEGLQKRVTSGEVSLRLKE